jgi:hypothetical protein
MKHFINLSTRVINKLHIIEIVKYPGKYTIYMNNNNINGLFLFSFGSISNTYNSITICEKDDKKDYDIITNFITSLDPKV